MRVLRIIFFSITAVLISISTGLAGELQVGDQAPDFRLPFASPDTINFDGIQLSDFRGKSNVIVAFYPADWSPGCTTEMCNLRDNFTALSQLNAQILGISGDYVFSHKAWIKHHGIQFRLLSDHLHKVAQMYNSYRPDVGMNKRTVYLIDKQGNIVYKNMDYTAGNAQDFQDLKSHLAALNK